PYGFNQTIPARLGDEHGTQAKDKAASRTEIFEVLHRAVARESLREVGEAVALAFRSVLDQPRGRSFPYRKVAPICGRNRVKACAGPIGEHRCRSIADAETDDERVLR